MIFLNVLKANARITELTATNDEQAALIEQLKSENETLKQNAAAFTMGSQDWASEKEALVKGHEEALATLQAEHAKALVKFETTVKETTDSAATKAAEIVASIGLEPETVKAAKDDLVASGKGFKVIDHLKK